MGGLIDLNTVNEDGDDDNFSSSVDGDNNGTQISSAASSSAVCMELWHACAGPLISLPKKGSVVVYFPQGHLEHFPDFPGISVDKIPPHVFCRVIDVKLHADAATDEVYAKLSLLPEIQIEEKLQERERDVNGEDGEEEEMEDAAKSTTPHMFCKTLTASDTSTHGGFSVPRRAAEDCFPPLDYKQQRPSQELIAKDLHGLQWRFRHIYRGQPRRHLLTTGWSAFINKKKLVSGDAVLFLRGADGELRLGIRRAVQIKGNTPPLSALPHKQLNHASLEAAFNAISARRAFSICYNPRPSSSEFVVPFRWFMKSFNHCFSVGTRFRMRFEAEDAAERRFAGVITGIHDMDPMRWPGSKWRCLLVRWDDAEANRHSRISPWEIEPSSFSIQSSMNLVASGLKRSRIGMPLTKPDIPIPGNSDLRDSLGIRKVLQGQEIFSFNAAYNVSDNLNHVVSPSMRCFPGSNNTGIAPCNIFPESFRFQKVLQGQEACPTQPHADTFYGDPITGSTGIKILEGVRVPSVGNLWSTLVMKSSNPEACQVSSPSSVLMFQQASIPAQNQDRFERYAGQCLSRIPDSKCSNMGLIKGYDKPCSKQQPLPKSKTSCRLFGISLMEGRNGGISEEGSLRLIPSPLSSETLSRPIVEGQPHGRSPAALSGAVGSSFGRRDQLLDIAL
ncbi:hypothetical protein Nepgr_021379 [Nepenthes gracilis]|uniref:Auxin response factor n=1 Tax=Nepenthes gracilis TaxID=150966 RepID=A0AAD3SY35_NEPGR|nr:hypothetical protein Nepgr_021379 [Nepenthes gracilis]